MKLFFWNAVLLLGVLSNAQASTDKRLQARKERRAEKNSALEGSLDNKSSRRNVRGNMQTWKKREKGASPHHGAKINRLHKTEPSLFKKSNKLMKSDKMRDSDMKQRMSEIDEEDEDLLDLIGQKTTKATEKLLKKLFGTEFLKTVGNKGAKKVLSGISQMFWAHIEAPLYAMNGQDREAVDSVLGGIGSIAGGVVGGPVGAFIGSTISTLPGEVIGYFDTTNPRFSVLFENVSPYHIRFSSKQTDLRSTSVMYAYVQGEGEEKFSTTIYNQITSVVIPKAVSTRESTEKVLQLACACAIVTHSKWAQVSFQLEGVDDKGDVKKTYDVAFKYPGGWYWEKHYVGIWENASWERVAPHDRDNYEPLYKMEQQSKEGMNNRPSTGKSNQSMGYWHKWEELHFVLA